MQDAPGGQIEGDRLTARGFRFLASYQLIRAVVEERQQPPACIRSKAWVNARLGNTGHD
jgi:hypothetical protein